MADTPEPDRIVGPWYTHLAAPFVVLTLLLVLASCAAARFHLDVKEFTAAVATCLTFTGLLFVVRQLMLNELVALNAHQWNKKKATFDFVKEYYSSVGGEIDKLKLQNPNKDHYKVAWNESKADDPEYLSTWRKVLNYFEHLCCGINHELYDNEIAYDHVRGVMVAMWSAGQPYVTKSREKNPCVFNNLELIVAKWEDAFRTRNHTKPTPEPLTAKRKR